MAKASHRLEIGQLGSAKHLVVGDKFVLGDGSDPHEHTITHDQGSHFQYDNRVNKRLSKDTLVKRVGEFEIGERTNIVSVLLKNAVKAVETDADVNRWSASMTNIITRAANYGMQNDVVMALEKLEKHGSAVFSRVKMYNNKKAIDEVNPAVRKRWTAEVNHVSSLISDALIEGLRTLVRCILVS